MNDLFLLEPEYRYHAERTRASSSRSATAAGSAASEDGRDGRHRREELDQLRCRCPWSTTSWTA